MSLHDETSKSEERTQVVSHSRKLLEQEQFKCFMEEYLKLTKAERALYVAHLKLLDAKFQAAHEKAALGGAGEVSTMIPKERKFSLLGAWISEQNASWREGCEDARAWRVMLDLDERELVEQWDAETPEEDIAEYEAQRGRSGV